jgi:hypothetical protein
MLPIRFYLNKNIFSELPDSKLSKLLWFLSPETVDNGKHEEFLAVREQRGLKADI